MKAVNSIDHEHWSLGHTERSEPGRNIRSQPRQVCRTISGKAVELDPGDGILDVLLVKISLMLMMSATL